MTTSSPRSAFEQQLCSQLLSLSGVAETLADRVMALEARLAEVEGQQLADSEPVAISDNAGELLSAVSLVGVAGSGLGLSSGRTRWALVGRLSVSAAPTASSESAALSSSP